MTEYFLWISFGGVVGGIFNALIAPVIFNAIVEYQLAMVVACLLLPPLGMGIEARVGVQLDLGVTALCVTVGTLLIGCRLWENDLPYAHVKQVPLETILWVGVGIIFLLGVGLFAALRYRDEQPPNRVAEVGIPVVLFFGALVLNAFGLWIVFLLTPQGRDEGLQPTPAWLLWGLVPLLIVGCVALNAGVAYLLYRWRTRFQRLQVLLDLVMPFAVLLLVIGLIWGLQARVMSSKLAQFSDLLSQPSSQIRVIFTFGLPAVLCYTFAERSMRFGLSVGAIILASLFTGLIELDRDSKDKVTIYQERSFFGVLRVESDGISHILYHGTTLHGRQYTTLFDGSDTEPITYYHPTGPIGHLGAAYDRPPAAMSRAVGLAAGATGKLVPPGPIGVIGLGTGTMACYARPGQRMTFYDIDPVVRKLTYSSTKYFTFVQQGRDRGAHIDLIMGDARLTLDAQ